LRSGNVNNKGVREVKKLKYHLYIMSVDLAKVVDGLIGIVSLGFIQTNLEMSLLVHQTERKVLK
jgi:hypothetical protein